MLYIYEDLWKFVDCEIKSKYPTKEIRKNIGRAWHCYRYILVSTSRFMEFIHYEYCNGYVELHLEGDNSSQYNNLRRFLHENLSNDDEYHWRNWNNQTRGLFRYETIIDDRTQLMDAFFKIIEKVEPLLTQYYSQLQGVVQIATANQRVKLMAPRPVVSLEKSIESVVQLPFDHFEIPQYQRPYKWKAKNVNQLINDIITFKDKQEYRLGTLVLHQDSEAETRPFNIVDGQQRIITVSLILYSLLDSLSDKEQNKYEDFIQKIELFWEKSCFENPISISNIRKNITTIKERISDMDDHFLNFLLNRCKFVVIKLPGISEAFQFFDSQNSRGKDLEPHDLLKAYHLREMNKLSEKDIENITSWQNHDTSKLITLFIMMYRIKQWPKGYSARYFTKDEIAAFKGFSLHNQQRYPNNMRDVICHYFIDLYASDPARVIDNSSVGYPFQLDSTCINGSRFFDMVRHYSEMYDKVIIKENYQVGSESHRIIDFLDTYKGSTRVGDQYVRSLFNTALLYYIDKFGFVEMDKIILKFFIWAYKLRLKNFAVQLATIDNYASENTLLKVIRDALTPAEVLNYYVPAIHEKDIASNAHDAIKSRFKDHNKLLIK